MVLEKTLESPLDCKEIQPVHPKGNQSWIFIARTDAEAETLILWLPDSKKWLVGKDPDAWKDWRQEEEMTQDETVGWHHWLDGHEFEQAPGVGDGQRSLVCCSPWGSKESDTTERLNWTELRSDYLRALRRQWQVCMEWEMSQQRSCVHFVGYGTDFFSHIPDQEMQVCLIQKPFRTCMRLWNQ